MALPDPTSGHDRAEHEPDEHQPDEHQPDEHQRDDAEHDDAEPELPEPVHVFPFDFSELTGLASRLAGVWPASSGVAVSRHQLTIRFGAWLITTPVDNIAGAGPTRELPFLAAGGPPRVDPRTGTLTLATATHGGVRLRFREPVTGGLPTDRVRHPEVIVTVRDPHGLVALLDVLRRHG